MLYGVDVHAGYQAGLSFATLRAQGYDFAAIKLTQGVSYTQDRGVEWIALARAAGLIPGAYHWLTAVDGAAQARYFHGQVVKAGGPDGMLIQLDVEDDGYGPQMAAWAHEWERLTGGHPFLIYSGAWWWPRTGGYRGASLTPYLWHSRYLAADADTVPDDPAAFAARIPASWWHPGYGGWDNATVIQFTSRGDAGSLGNNVDLNVTRLTRAQLLALTRSGTAGGGAPIPTTPEESDMDLGDNLRAFGGLDITVGAALTTLLVRTDYIGNKLGLAARLDAILAAARDDGDTTVVLPPDAVGVLTQIKAAIEAVPTAVEVADAVNDDAAARLVG